MIGSSRDDTSIRLLPRHGVPTSHLEWLTQTGITCLSWFPIYTIILILLTITSYVWIFPCVREHS